MKIKTLKQVRQAHLKNSILLLMEFMHQQQGNISLAKFSLVDFQQRVGCQIDNLGGENYTQQNHNIRKIVSRGENEAM